MGAFIQPEHNNPQEDEGKKVRNELPVAYRRSIAFFTDSAVLLLSRSSTSRKFLQYSQFGSEQYGDPDLAGWCGTGWLDIF